jgi:hypothetical protein
MMRTRTLFSAVLALAFLAGAVQAQKDKATPKDAKAITAKVQAVDTQKGTITVTTDSGKVLVLKVDKDTSIVGPRGGKSDERLKDDRLAKGSEIKITLAADGKTAKEIKLPFRKKPAKDKDKPKEKKGS